MLPSSNTTWLVILWRENSAGSLAMPQPCLHGGYSQDLLYCLLPCCTQPFAENTLGISYFFMNNSSSFTGQDSCSKQRVTKLQLPHIIIDKQVFEMKKVHFLLSGSWNPEREADSIIHLIDLVPKVSIYYHPLKTRQQSLSNSPLDFLWLSQQVPLCHSFCCAFP